MRLSNFLTTSRNVRIAAHLRTAQIFSYNWLAYSKIFVLSTAIHLYIIQPSRSLNLILRWMRTLSKFYVFCQFWYLTLSKLGLGQYVYGCGYSPITSGNWKQNHFQISIWEKISRNNIFISFFFFKLFVQTDMISSKYHSTFKKLVHSLYWLLHRMELFYQHNYQ